MPPARGGRPPRQRGQQRQELSPEQAKQLVSKILDPGYDPLSAVEELFGRLQGFGQLSYTSYRKLHELMAGALDTAITRARGKGGLDEETKRFLRMSLAQARVYIDYQVIRRQMPEKDWAILLREFIHALGERLGSQASIDVLERARLALDVLVTAAYQKRKRG